LLVLHDIPGACVDALPGFLDALRDRGVEIVSDLPRPCTPILDGRVIGELDGLVAVSA
jgi:hypothetical protein